MNMTIEEIDSILQGNRKLPSKISLTNLAWHYLTRYFDNLSVYRGQGDRSILDIQLPQEFVELVLKESKLNCFKTSDEKFLRSWRGYADDEEISAVDVYLRYGGTILEQVYERSVVSIFSI
jgi:hypothetical protein